jgi:hypothetical protein
VPAIHRFLGENPDSQPLSFAVWVTLGRRAFGSFAWQLYSGSTSRPSSAGEDGRAQPTAALDA